MTKLNQIWKCEVCGNIIEILHEGADSLVCCGQPMKIMEPKTKDPELGEKHVPVIGGNTVSIGSIEHPMTDKHHIEWIEATDKDGKKARVFLKPGQKPEAEFWFNPVSAREYCNLHGLWKKE
jgi:superoxide reductase